LTLLVVKVAAATQGNSLKTTAKSFLPVAFMPQATPAAQKPSGVVIEPSVTHSIFPSTSLRVVQACKRACVQVFLCFNAYNLHSCTLSSDDKYAAEVARLFCG
jgi:hypothetical protein